MVKSLKERPQDTFIRILYKISEEFSSLKIRYDLEETIDYYNNKDIFSPEDLKQLQKTCKDEWNKLLNILCDDLITKINKKKKSREILKDELKEIRQFKEKLKRNEISLEKYENQFFGKEFRKLKKSIEKELGKQRWETKKFWGSLGIGFVLGFLGNILFNWIMSLL